MKESYVEGLATHDGPESCVCVRKGVGEALTGVRAGRVLSREKGLLRGADPLGDRGRPHRQRRYREAMPVPARSKRLRTHGNTSYETREIPSPPLALVAQGRVGKSKDTRR